MKRRSYQDLAAFGGIVLLAFVIRAYTFLSASFDWDEGIYVLMGSSLLDGHLPYTEFWDVKPPLIYLTYALGLFPFDHSLIGVRILAVMAVAATGCLIFQFARRFCRCGFLAAFVSALLYALFTAAEAGAAANTELFIAPLTLGALYLVFSTNWSPADKQNHCARRWLWQIAGAGFVIAVAVQYKYVALFDLLFFVFLLAARMAFQQNAASALPGVDRIPVWIVAAPLLTVIAPSLLLFVANVGVSAVLPGASLITLILCMAMIWVTRNEDPGQAVRLFFRACCFLCLPAVILLLAIVSLYSLAGAGDVWFRANVLGNMANTGWDLEPAVLQSAVRNFCLRTYPLLLPFLALPGLIWFDRDKNSVLAIASAWTYFGFIGLGVFATKRFYDHYFLLLLPVLAISAGYFLDRLPNSIASTSKAYGASLRIVTAIAFVSGAMAADPALVRRLADARHLILGNRQGTDETGSVSKWLLEQGSAGQTIYVLDANPIIYFLSKSQAPTRYAFPPFLIHRFFVNVAGIDRRAEVTLILKQRPEFIIRRRTPLWWLTSEDYQFLDEIKEWVRQDYVVAHTTDGFEILRRTPQPDK